jgi:hypothetical protein
VLLSFSGEDFFQYFVDFETIISAELFFLRNLPSKILACVAGGIRGHERMGISNLKFRLGISSFPFSRAREYRLLRRLVKYACTCQLANQNARKLIGMQNDTNLF